MAFDVFAFDIVTSAPLGRLDVTGDVVWSERINARMTLECTLDLADEPTAEFVPNLIDFDQNCVRPVKLVIYDRPSPTEKPDMVYEPFAKSFMLWDATLSADRRYLRLQCSGLWSWFGQFPLSTSFTFNDVEQHDIAATLINWAQAAERGGGIGVATNGFALSGRTRDRTYNRFEFTSVGQRVDELAAVIDGFDFAIETTFDGNVTVSEQWVPSYPRAGRSWPASEIQVDVDGLASATPVAWRQPTTRVREIGAGEGDTMLTEQSVDGDLESSGWPRLFHVETRKSVERAETLQTHSERDLQLVNRGNEAWSPTVLDTFNLLKGLTVGDECQLDVIPNPNHPDYMWPDGRSVVRRVIGRTVTVPAAGGPDQVQLELEESDF